MFTKSQTRFGSAAEACGKSLTVTCSRVRRPVAGHRDSADPGVL